MPDTRVFQRVAGLRPGRSVFDLSYDKKFTCDMGELIPVLCEMAVPGDHWTIGNQVVVRLQPLLAPIMHAIDVVVHYFFVPLRILEGVAECWDWTTQDWENFITGGEEGDWEEKELPRWNPPTGVVTLVGSLWDYMGMPQVIPTGATPLAFPLLAYWRIWDEYYRDQNFQDKKSPILTDQSGAAVAIRNWEKDYFTSSLPWQQRGTAPSLPISGTTTALWDINDIDEVAAVDPNKAITIGNMPLDTYKPRVNIGYSRGRLHEFLERNSIDLSSATTFDVADLRLVVQLQKWMERNARAGSRLTESLQAHFNVSPRDERLQRPEYIGGTKSPVIISEVLQTSEEGTTPQGNLAGHGISANRGMAGKYFVTEHGIIMGLMSIMPRTCYQQGVDRQWLQQTRYDFYWPEFANLSEQAVIKAEIAAKNADSAHNQALFGYIGRYDEYRTKKSMVCGEMRDKLDYWHLGRKFADVSTVELNEEFIQCRPSKRIFAVQDEDGFIVNFGNLIKAVRPIPIQANPGLMDHF